MDDTLSSIPTVTVVTETEFVSIRRSTIHGTGGFARQNIKAGQPIIEYVGEKISKAESLQMCEANNEYIFDLGEEHDLNGNVDWNPAKYINHSCAPNCEAEEDEGRIWINALRDIVVGEELTFNYGYTLEDYQEHVCRCGASTCIGYIVAEEFFDAIKALPKTGSQPIE